MLTAALAGLDFVSSDLPLDLALIYKDADVSMSDEQEELEEESEEEIKEIMSKN